MLLDGVDSVELDEHVAGSVTRADASGQIVASAFGQYPVAAPLTEINVHFIRNSSIRTCSLVVAVIAVAVVVASAFRSG